MSTNKISSLPILLQSRKHFCHGTVGHSQGPCMEPGLLLSCASDQGIKRKLGLASKPVISQRCLWGMTEGGASIVVSATSSSNQQPAGQVCKKTYTLEPPQERHSTSSDLFSWALRALIAWLPFQPALVRVLDPAPFWDSSLCGWCSSYNWDSWTVVGCGGKTIEQQVTITERRERLISFKIDITKTDKINGTYWGGWCRVSICLCFFLDSTFGRPVGH